MSQSQTLLDLQRLDVDIIRLKKQLDTLPEKAALLELRSKRREVDSMHEKANLLITKLESEIKARADETATLTEKIAGEQAKIMESQDHRMVRSITREMDGFKRRIDKIEMESMQFMERLQKAESQVAKIDEALQQYAAEDAVLVARYQERGRGLQAEIAALNAKREGLTPLMDPELLARYESIRDIKGGSGVGRLENDRCSACRMTMPAGRLHELTTGPDIGSCPQCGRLLVVRGSGE